MPSTNDIILQQYNSSGNWDEKLITPESDKVLGFDASLNPVQLSKQDTLVSGTNIKTVNGNSLLGSGNISIASPTINYLDSFTVPTGSGTLIIDNMNFYALVGQRFKAHYLMVVKNDSASYCPTINFRHITSQTPQFRAWGYIWTPYNNTVTPIQRSTVATVTSVQVLSYSVNTASWSTLEIVLHGMIATLNGSYGLVATKNAYGALSIYDACLEVSLF